MNFEFKSTFKYLSFPLKPMMLYSIPLPVWIIVFNGMSTAIILSLYFSNYFLPAVVASMPHGTAYILLIEIGIAVKILSSTYAGVSLTRRHYRKTLKVLAKAYYIAAGAYHIIKRIALRKACTQIKNIPGTVSQHLPRLSIRKPFTSL